MALTKQQLESMSLEEVNAFNAAQISGASITGSDLTTEPSLNFNKPEPTTIPDISKIDTTLQDTATQSAPAETNVSDLIKRITDTQSSILGESAFTAEQQKAQGITDLTSKQNDLVAQIQSFQTQSAALENQKTLAEERIIQESEGRGRSIGGISPLIASAQRKITLQQADIASQALIAQANLYGTQGKLATANMLVEQAVSAKFGAKREQLKADMANLDLLLKDPAIDKAVKDRAAAQLLIKQKQDTELKKETDNFEEAQKETLKYSGIADSVTLAAMSKCKDALCVAGLAQNKGLKTLEQQKAEKELAAFGDSADIKEFKSFFSNVDIKTPAGQQQFLNWKAKVEATGRVPEGITSTYIPGANPTVDNWARLIIAGQATITNVPNPRGSTLRSDVINAINSSGQLLLSDKDREKLSTLDTAFNVYETIKGLSEKINTFGVAGRVTGYLKRYIGGATQYNTDIARYKSARQGFVSNVARTLGEKGTLAEGDVQRAISNLPTPNDTEAVAEGKLETLRSILQGAKDSIIQKSTEPLTGTTSGTLPQNTPETLRTKYNY